jgi:hypothetical protein
MKSYSKFVKDSKKKELNPKFWDGTQLRPEVRAALIRIGYAWAEYANIPEEAIEDMVIVGGNAGYFYNEMSDLDLHLVIDSKKISDCDGLLNDYLRAKKKLWGLLQDVEIYGTDVEIYAEDSNEPKPISRGRYSVINDKWEDFPANEIPKLDDDQVLRKVQEYADKIDDLIEAGVDDLPLLTKIDEKIKNLRKQSLAKGDEFSEGNLVFKLLRNMGYIDKMDAYFRSVIDNGLSI